MSLSAVRLFAAAARAQALACGTHTSGAGPAVAGSHSWLSAWAVTEVSCSRTVTAAQVPSTLGWVCDHWLASTRSSAAVLAGGDDGGVGRAGAALLLDPAVGEGEARADQDQRERDDHPWQHAAA